MNIKDIIHIYKTYKAAMTSLYIAILILDSIMFCLNIYIGIIMIPITLYLLWFTNMQVYNVDIRPKKELTQVKNVIDDILFNLKYKNKIVVYAGKTYYKILTTYITSTNVSIILDKSLDKKEYSFTKKNDMLTSINDIL